MPDIMPSQVAVASSGGWQTYTLSPTISGGTPPASAVALRYRWTKIADLTWADFHFEWATPGVGNSGFVVPFMADMPIPDFPANQEAASETGYPTVQLSGAGETSLGGINHGAVRRNSGNNGYEASGFYAASNTTNFMLSVRYGS